MASEPETGPSVVRNAGLMAMGAAAGIGALVAASTPLQNSLKGWPRPLKRGFKEAMKYMIICVCV